MPRCRSFFTAVAAAALLVQGMGGTAQGSDLGAIASPTGVGTTAATAGCGKTPTLTSGTHTIQSGGKNRSFILKIPDTYDNNYPHRLAFGFHWLGGTDDQVASGGSDGYAWAYYGMQSQSGNSTIFVAPQGISNGWANSNGEDVTFTDDMIRLIEGDLCVDSTQLFSVGFSYGGAMSYSLACSRATVFRAVVAIASPNGISGCSGGTQPIAYMGIHGISDNIAGGRAQRDRFVGNNGCTPQNAPEPAPGSLTHIITHYSGCRAGYPVVWAAFDGGHQQGPVDGCAGCESGAKSWDKAEIWKFFAQFGTSGNAVTVTSPGDQSAASGTPISALQIHATDSAAGETLTFSATGLPPGLSISSGGLITGTPSSGGTFTTTVAATDTTGAAGSASFAWAVSGGGTGGGSGPLHAVGAGKCLDDPNSSTSGGTQQQIRDCTGGAGQSWSHTSTRQLSVTISGSTLCLDANSQGTSSGTKAIIWSCNGQPNQQWNLNSNGTITGQQSGLCLDVSGASTANGAQVQLWTCNGASNQQWKLGN